MLPDSLGALPAAAPPAGAGAGAVPVVLIILVAISRAREFLIYINIDTL